MADLSPKPPVSSQLHLVNIIIAILAGSVSIVGGLYSLKSNFMPSEGKGSLQGIVRDSVIVKPLWMAPVEVAESGGALVATINTDRKGGYHLNSLKEGDYVVKVSAPFHQSATRNIKIYAKNSTTVNFDLLPDDKPTTVSSPSFAQSAPSQWQQRRNRLRQKTTDDPNAPSVRQVVAQSMEQWLEDWASQKGKK